MLPRRRCECTLTEADHQGAAFTFDAKAYTSFVLALRETPLLPGVEFRTFSHAKKDPEPGPFLIAPSHKIIVIEGLYVLLDIDPWIKSVAALDERVWIECPAPIARERLITRHLIEGVEDVRDKAEKRGS